MKKTSKEIYIKIKTNKGILKIPFTTLQSIDSFTVRFENEEELASMFLPTNSYNIEYVKLGYKYKSPEKKNDGEGNEIKPIREIYKELPIKYAEDNYDVNDLFQKLEAFLRSNKQFLEGSSLGIDKILENSRKKAISIGNEEGKSNYELGLILTHLRAGGYKVTRDAYFILKEHGIKVKINSIRHFKAGLRESTNTLQSMQMKDDYAEYLQSYASKGEEEYNFAIEELSLYDLDKIPSTTSSLERKPLFDGTTATLEYEDDLLYILDEIEEIRPNDKNEIYQKLCGKKYVPKERRYERNK